SAYFFGVEGQLLIPRHPDGNGAEVLQPRGGAGAVPTRAERAEDPGLVARTDVAELEPGSGVRCQFPGEPPEGNLFFSRVAQQEEFFIEGEFDTDDFQVEALLPRAGPHEPLQFFRLLLQ